MIFSSYVFIFCFLPLALLAYYAVPRRWKQITLTLFSFAFYGWANPYFVLLMLFSSSVDYLAGLVIANQIGTSWAEPAQALDHRGTRTRLQKLALLSSIVANLSLLMFFKYFNFGIENYNTLMTMLGLDHSRWDSFYRIAFPVGISFYTFHAMSYAIDVYWGEAQPIRNYVDYLCFVAMFPQLVAGPIVRFHEVSSQLQQREHSPEKFARGVAFFACGLAKKIFLANSCGKVADACFNAGTVGFGDSWYGLIAYAFQIYFDFSGYSDMAIGLGLMLGFVYPKNFDSPYQSFSITEFWRRWHLSLSTVLRDYLYVPLGGNRKGPMRTYANLMTVMLLGGLWHGASWNFVIWGAIHGGMLSLERMQGKDSFYRQLFRPMRVAVTFLIVCVSWVFFRAKDLSSSMAYLKSLLGAGGALANAKMLGGLIYQPYYLLMIAAAAVFVWFAPQTWDFTRRLTLPKALWCLFLLLISIATMITQDYNPFIYFIF